MKTILVSVLLLSFAVPVLASDRGAVTAPLPMFPSIGAAHPLTLQTALAQKEKDLVEYWFKSADGHKRKMWCDGICTHDCYNSWFACYTAPGAEPAYCCAQWRWCIVWCCTEPPADDECPG